MGYIRPNVTFPLGTYGTCAQSARHGTNSIQIHRIVTIENLATLAAVSRQVFPNPQSVSVWRAASPGESVMRWMFAAVVIVSGAASAQAYTCADVRALSA